MRKIKSIDYEMFITQNVLDQLTSEQRPWTRPTATKIVTHKNRLNNLRFKKNMTHVSMFEHAVKCLND